MVTAHVVYVAVCLYKKLYGVNKRHVFLTSVTVTSNDTVQVPVVGEVVFVLFPSANATFDVTVTDEAS